MVDFSKHKHGDVVVVHCCDKCARKAGVNPKRPADSGKASWLCDVCGHHGIGSLTDCEIGDWLRLRPLTPVGWSDTDWIKYLQEQDEQPHPLAGQHINQGSMDAAADAYEAEYNAARGIT